jgi:hypothetical protein
MPGFPLAVPIILHWRMLLRHCKLINYDGTRTRVFFLQAYIPFCGLLDMPLVPRNGWVAKTLWCMAFVSSAGHTL